MEGAHFIADHGLWSDEQRAQAQALKQRLEREPLELVRLAWADPHGASRAKAVSPAAFFDALERGYNINVATTTLDSAGARVFSPHFPPAHRQSVVAVPPSRTVLSEFRAGETRQLAAWCAHRLSHGKIEAKQVNLLERDQSLRNPSILL